MSRRWARKLAPPLRAGAPRTRLLLWIGAAEAVLLGLAAWWPGAGAPLPLLPLLGAAFALYLLGAAVVGDGGPRAGLPRSEAGTGAGVGSREEGRSPAVIWGVALLLRAVLLPVAPELSDDFHRYLWDGHVQLAGINPFLHAPASEALDGLRTAWSHLINHPEVPTIYPPLAQIVFLGVAWAGGGVWALKLLWTALELSAALALARVAERSGRPVGRVLVLYLWSPLLVVETAWNAHVDALGIAALALVLLLRRPGLRGGALGLAAAAKLAPAAALPSLVRRAGWKAGAAFTGVLVLLHLPYLDAGAGLFAGLGAYASEWRFMAGPYLALEAVFPGEVIPRAAAGALVVAVVAAVTLRGFDVERSLFWILGAGLLLTPTFHPWYALWILPFAALRASPPWILLCGLAPLGYVGLGPYLRAGTWPEPLWARLLLWTPVLALLVREGVRLAGTGGRLPDDEGGPGP